MLRPSISDARSPRSFFEAFRIVAWQFLYYLRGLGDLSPEYDECPAVCPDEPDRRGNAMCDECPRREAREEFDKAAIGFLNERLGTEWERYGFRNIFDQVLNASELDEKTEGLTLIAARCVAILSSERARMRRIDDWIERQKRPPA